MNGIRWLLVRRTRHTTTNSSWTTIAIPSGAWLVIPPIRPSIVASVVMGVTFNYYPVVVIVVSSRWWIRIVNGNYYWSWWMCGYYGLWRIDIYCVIDTYDWTITTTTDHSFSTKINSITRVFRTIIIIRRRIVTVLPHHCHIDGDVNESDTSDSSSWPAWWYNHTLVSLRWIITIMWRQRIMISTTTTTHYHGCYGNGWFIRSPPPLDTWFKSWGRHLLVRWYCTCGDSGGGGGWKYHHHHRPRHCNLSPPPPPPPPVRGYRPMGKLWCSPCRTLLSYAVYPYCIHPYVSMVVPLWSICGKIPIRYEIWVRSLSHCIKSYSSCKSCKSSFVVPTVVAANSSIRSWYAMTMTTSPLGSWPLVQTYLKFIIHQHQTAINEYILPLNSQE